MNRTQRATPDLHTLVELFYPSVDDLADFTEVTESKLPQPYRRLLVHDSHMTVTVEAHHGCPVDVHVLDVHQTPTHYSRKILLTRQSDNRVVQFGIVRLNLDYLGPDVRREIESQQAPLGRILIEHDVLRTVKLLSLWRVAAGGKLGKLFGLDKPAVTYGRTALIYCNGIPAVELLEIVTSE